MFGGGINASKKRAKAAPIAKGGLLVPPQMRAKLGPNKVTEDPGALYKNRRERRAEKHSTQESSTSS